MNKLHLTTILLALTTAILLCNDFRWVKATKQWTASGIASTEVFPLFGDDFRISYSTRKGGALKITLVDASPSGKRKADKVVVDTKHFATPDRKGLSGYGQAYLVVEGDPRGWVVTVDQYLDEIQEWRFKNYTEDDAFRKLAVWADQGTKEISFDAPIQPWRLTLAAAEAKRVKLTVSTPEGKVLYQRHVLSANAPMVTWFHAVGPVNVSVDCDGELGWTITADAPASKPEK